MKAIIEIPLGDDRRRHMKYDKSGFIDLGPTKEVIPVNDGVMPVNYGYIKDTLNIGEGDEIDVLIFSKQILSVGQEIDILPFALIRRADGDDKVVSTDNTLDIKSWEDIEQGERELIEKFFSYHHKFIAIENKESAEKYIESGYREYLSKK
jgi:inorganic pyrophosphatase